MDLLSGTNLLKVILAKINEIIAALTDLTSSVSNSISSLSNSITAVANRIPTRTSQLTNDSDYATNATVNSNVNALNNSISAVNNRVPTKLSQLSNDVGYVAGGSGGAYTVPVLSVIWLKGMSGTSDEASVRVKAAGGGCSITVVKTKGNIGYSYENDVISVSGGEGTYYCTVTITATNSLGSDSVSITLVSYLSNSGGD